MAPFLNCPNSQQFNPAQTPQTPDVPLYSDPAGDALDVDDLPADNAHVVSVHTCYCQASPITMPRNYIPCCLPTGLLLATKAIQIFEEFRGNLLRAKGEPAKTQTIRGWKTARAKENKQSFLEGKWIRVWRGQGNKDTIGWLRINVWDTVKLGSIDQGDCVREDRPSWT